MPTPDWCVPPIPTNTGHWDSGLAADSRWSHTRLCRDSHCGGISAPFSGRRKCLPKQGRRPNPLIMDRLLRAPSTNTELSACYGTSATLGQHKACPDRYDSERTRPVTTPSVPPSHDLRPSFVPLEHAYATYDASLTYINDDVVLFWHPPSVFPQ